MLMRCEVYLTVVLPQEFIIDYLITNMIYVYTRMYVFWNIRGDAIAVNCLGA